MRRAAGVICVILGILCLCGAASFLMYNHLEEEHAEESSASLVSEVRVSIEEAAAEDVQIEEAPQQNLPQTMPTVPVGEDDCIGILSIPVLELELPVLTNWSYAKLKKAPCHYYGACYDTDFVIAGHNYRSHFGRFSELVPGDLVLFTDAEGTVYCYEVVLTETLPKTATEEMITSGFDLSLYTCTPGGENRVTVRCMAVENE